MNTSISSCAQKGQTRWRSLIAVGALLSASACTSGSSDGTGVGFEDGDEDNSRQDSSSGSPPESPSNSSRGGGGGTSSPSSAKGGSGGPLSLPPPSPAPNQGAPPSASPATNPFVATAHDPFSTFAIDVDTASYDIFRRDVNLGRLPSRSQVRLEEFVNAFRYDYPSAGLTEETPFAVGITAAASPFSAGTTLLRVHVQGKPAAAFEKRPTNLVYLIDVSGSMASSDKIGLVKQLARQSLDVLDPTDKVSIVTYAGSTSVRLAPTEVTRKTAIRAVIDGLQVGGSTSGASGINLAYEQAQAAFIPNGINHVVLCTDGDFNVGISNTKDLVDLIVQKRKTGITLTALGFGADNLNDTMMEQVSNAGNGMYSVISSEAQAASYVQNGLLASIVHIAKDVKIQVEFNPAVVVAYRLLGYENRDIADEDFRNDVIDAGEIGAGHQVTALYELALDGAQVVVPPTAPAIKSGPPVEGVRHVIPSDLAMVKVRFKAPDAKEADPAREIAGRIARGEVATTLAAADQDLQWAAAVAGFSEILKGSPFANAQSLGTIQAVVEAQSMRAEGRAEFAALLRRALPLLPK